MCVCAINELLKKSRSSSFLFKFFCFVSCLFRLEEMNLVMFSLPTYCCEKCKSYQGILPVYKSLLLFFFFIITSTVAAYAQLANNL